MTRVELIVQEIKDTFVEQISKGLLEDIVINDIDYDELIEVIDILGCTQFFGYFVSHKIEKHLKWGLFNTPTQIERQLRFGTEYKMRITIEKCRKFVDPGTDLS